MDARKLSKVIADSLHSKSQPIVNCRPERSEMDCSADKDLFCSELKNTYSITVFRKWPLAAGGFINHRNTDPRYHSVHCVPFMNHLLSRVPYIIHFVPPCSVGEAFVPPLGGQCDPFINTFCSVHKMHIAGVSLVLQCKISSLYVPFIIYLFPHRLTIRS